MTPVAHASRRAYLWQLINEYAQNEILLVVLDIDIESRRKIEDLQRIPFEQKRSISVEKRREIAQEEKQRLKHEIDAAINLIGKDQQ